jgi:hypothetical protein
VETGPNIGLGVDGLGCVYMAPEHNPRHSVEWFNYVEQSL